MLLDQGSGLRGDHRPNALFHELAVPHVELFAWVAGERCKLEVEELVNVEGAILVLFIEGDVLRLLHFTVEYALANQELSPGEV